MKKNVSWCELRTFMPLKKFILIMCFIFLTYLLTSIIYKVFFLDAIVEFDDMIFFIVVIGTCFFVGKYSFKIFKEKFKCVPIISKYIPRRELKKLILADDFEPVEDFKESKFYKKFLVGKNWLYINNYFISIKSIASVVLLEKSRGYRGYSSGTPYIDYYLLFTYINGETRKIFIDTLNWQITTYEIECEINENFEKILVDTLYKVIDINGLCIKKFDVKDYYKRAECINKIAKRYNIKRIEVKDIIYENEHKSFMLSEGETVKIDGRAWLSIVERPTKDGKRR